MLIAIAGELWWMLLLMLMGVFAFPAWWMFIARDDPKDDAGGWLHRDDHD